MFNTLLHLAQTIALHASRLRAPTAESLPALQNLVKSARDASPKPFRAPAHTYGPLVTAAARFGLQGRDGDIAAALLAAQESLPWVYHYPRRSPDENLSDKIAFAELIGPDGPMQAPDCRVGFTVLAERTVYPMHNHPAVELYLVISGNAIWRTASSERTVAPGELVLHRSNEPHEMQTFAEPLLALWGWTGDLDAPAIYL